jgi:hypothetical protein
MRTALAVLGAFIYPGVGHAVLQRWRRGAAWFGLAFATATVAVLVTDVPVNEVETLQGAFELQSQLPWQGTAAVLLVSSLNVADAYLVARRDDGDGESGPTCPDCGGDLDEDLEFCPWCTNRLDATSR